MTPRDVVRAEKTVVKAGSWKVVTGKGGGMTNSSFPLSKRDGVRLGRHWHWRVDELIADKMTLRLLTAFEPRLGEFMAWLSWNNRGTVTVIARLESHATHPGLHCHSVCGPVDGITPGEPIARDSVRLPGGTRYHRPRKGITTENDALNVSFAFFRVNGTMPGLLV